MNPPAPIQENNTPPVESVSTDQVHIVPNASTPPQTPPPTPKRPNMLIIVVAAILFLGILGTGSYFAYQNYKLAKQPIQTVSTVPSPNPTETPDPTANWILYTNSQYKFSLKHPMEVSVLGENLLGNFDLVFNKGAKNPFIIEVDVKGKVPAGSTGERKIGDITWSEYVLPATKTTPSIYSLVTLNGNNLYKVIGLYSKDLDPTTLQILSTFKFTDQTVDTANWKSISENDFKLSIPSDWTVEQSTNSGQVSWVFSGGTPKKDSLLIGKVTTSLEKTKSDVLGLFSTPPTTRTITLGKATATEYYGCAGVEGCINEYILVTSSGTSVYQIDFIVYQDQDKSLYQSVISNLKF